MAHQALLHPKPLPLARREYQLFLHPYPCELTTISFGLEQPRLTSPQLLPEKVDQTIDAALILGLGFDRRGYRLGYGAGYFDRFLAGRQFPTIGWAYDMQLIDGLPVEAHDVAMNAVLTESSFWRSRGTG